MQNKNAVSFESMKADKTHLTREGNKYSFFHVKRGPSISNHRSRGQEYFIVLSGVDGFSRTYEHQST